MSGFLGMAVLLLAAMPLVVSQIYAGTGYGTGQSERHYFKPETHVPQYKKPFISGNGPSPSGGYSDTSVPATDLNKGKDPIASEGRSYPEEPVYPFKETPPYGSFEKRIPTPHGGYAEPSGGNRAQGQYGSRYSTMLLSRLLSRASQHLEGPGVSAGYRGHETQRPRVKQPERAAALPSYSKPSPTPAVTSFESMYQPLYKRPSFDSGTGGYRQRLYRPFYHSRYGYGSTYGRSSEPSAYVQPRYGNAGTRSPTYYRPSYDSAGRPTYQRPRYDSSGRPTYQFPGYDSAGRPMATHKRPQYDRADRLTYTSPSSSRAGQPAYRSRGRGAG